jgi:trigger factor
MQTHVEEISQVKRRITVEIEAEKVNLMYDQALRELSKKAKIKGFRPGKTPKRIIEQYYGTQIISEVKNDLIRESFSEAIEETGLTPLTSPSIEDGTLLQNKPFTYTIEIEVRPGFELKDYMGISVEKEISDITEDMVEKRLEELREIHAQLVSIDEGRGVQEGDYAIIDYTGLWNGKPLRDMRGNDFTVHVGSKHFYPDVETGIVGLKKDEEKEIQVDFNADFADKRVAGRSVVFHVKIKEIKNKDLPELNDEFARTLGDEFPSVKVLRERVREDLVLQEEKRMERDVRSRLLKKIADTVDFELPKSLVEQEINRSLASIKQSVLYSGSQIESAGIPVETMRDELRPVAERKIKEDFILGKIADIENITIDENDTRDGFQKLAAQTGKDPAVLERFYETNNLMDSFRDQILKEKTLNHLLQGAKINIMRQISEKTESD